MHRQLIALFVVLLGACAPRPYIETGEEALQYKRYPEAVSLLTAELDQQHDSENKAIKAYWIGEAYRAQALYDQGLSWYQKAAEWAPNRISREAYAYALMRAQRYDQAEPMFRELQQDYGQDPAWSLAINGCRAGRSWLASSNPNQHIMTRLPLNTSASDWGYTFVDSVFIWTSDRPQSLGDTYHWTDLQHSDLFISNPESALSDLLHKINSDYNESGLTISSDGSIAVTTRCGSDDDLQINHCQLMALYYDPRHQIWSEPTKIPFCDENFSYGHGVFYKGLRSIEGLEVLIFSSDQPGGKGGHDLWMTTWDKENLEWSDPAPLDGAINTAFDDVHPTLEGDTLYFSSNGHVGMGGWDVFSSHLSTDGLWTNIENLGPPYNSSADDFNFMRDPHFSPDEKTIHRGYISSNRSGSQRDDIYRIDEMRIEPDSTTSPAPPRYAIIIGDVMGKHTSTSQSSAEWQPLPQAKVTSNIRQTNPISLDEKASFSIKVSEAGQYTFSASAKDYYTDSRTIQITESDLENSQEQRATIVQLRLLPIEYDVEIVLENIYYDYDEWAIREDARPALDSLANLLNNNPGISIELGSHTDCRGLEIYNAQLAQRRAQSAVNYLIQAGVEAYRLKAIGYGERSPAVNCVCEDCTEAEHQANRRTTFKVVKR